MRSGGLPRTWRHDRQHRAHRVGDHCGTSDDARVAHSIRISTGVGRQLPSNRLERPPSTTPVIKFPPSEASSRSQYPRAAELFAADFTQAGLRAVRVDAADLAVQAAVFAPRGAELAALAGAHIQMGEEAGWDCEPDDENQTRTLSNGGTVGLSRALHPRSRGCCIQTNHPRAPESALTGRPQFLILISLNRSLKLQDVNTPLVLS